ncbi:DUF4190 domain-containing protein [Eggerthellaceae bacterium 24-137]
MEEQPNFQQPDSPDNQTPPNKAIDPTESLELKSARTLAMVASIAGPVSLIIGGVALSTVAIVCAIIALTKIRHILAQPDSPQRAYALALKRTALMGIGVGTVALILNAVSVAMILPTLLEAMRTGDYSAILGDAASSLQSTPQQPSGGNAWG